MLIVCMQGDIADAAEALSNFANVILAAAMCRNLSNHSIASVTSNSYSRLSGRGPAMISDPPGMFSGPSAVRACAYCKS